MIRNYKFFADIVQISKNNKVLPILALAQRGGMRHEVRKGERETADFGGER